MSAALREFLETEIAGGVFLLIAAVAALLWANSSFRTYDAIWTGELPGQLGRVGLPEDLRSRSTTA
jgi:Na+/H+ antiporter NhaA